MKRYEHDHTSNPRCFRAFAQCHGYWFELKPSLDSSILTTSVHSFIAPSPTSPQARLFSCGRMTSNQPDSIVPSWASVTPQSSISTRICFAVMGWSHMAVWSSGQPENIEEAS